MRAGGKKEGQPGGAVAIEYTDYKKDKEEVGRPPSMRLGPGPAASSALAAAARAALPEPP